MTCVYKYGQINLQAFSYLIFTRWNENLEN